MSIYITGDVHGEPIRRFSYKQNPGLTKLTENDYMIILGDWGVPWNNESLKYDKYQLEFIDSKPWTTIALRGNHDNTDLMREMPQEEKFGGKVRRLVVADAVADHVYIVDEPTVLTIENQKCLCIPGAKSHDLQPCEKGYKGLTIVNPADPQAKELQRYYRKKNIFYRTLGESWWEDEDIDIDKTYDILFDHNHYDFIFTHDYPGAINNFYKKPSAYTYLSSTDGQRFLEGIRNTVSFDCWFHGHIHADMKQLIPSDDRVMALYQSILKAV